MSNSGNKNLNSQYIWTTNRAGFFTYALPNFYIDYDLYLEENISPSIQKQTKVKIGNAEGYECSMCSDFFPMAELNQPENVKEFTYFSCYSCRKGLKLFIKVIK